MATTDNKIVTHATIFTDDASHNTPSYIYAKQYDKNSRYITVTLMSAAGQVVVSTSARLNMTKPDDTTIYTNATIESDGSVTFKIPGNVMDLVGVVNCDITVYASANSDTVLLTSSTFYIVVDKSNYDLDAAPGSDEYVIAARASDLRTSVIDDETVIHLVDSNGDMMGHGVPFSGGGGGNVQSDWNQTDTTAPSYIKNKPTIPPAITVDSTVTSSSSNPVASSGIYDAIQTAIEQATFDDNNFVNLGNVTLTGTGSGFEYTFNISAANASAIEESFRTRQDSMVLFQTTTLQEQSAQMRYFVLRKSWGNLANENDPLVYTGTTTVSSGDGEEICVVNASFDGTTCTVTILPVVDAIDEALAAAEGYTDNAVAGKEDSINKTQTISVLSTHTQYPTAKATYDAINGKRGLVELSSFTSVMDMSPGVTYNKMYAFSYAADDYPVVSQVAANGGSDDLKVTIALSLTSYTGLVNYIGIRGIGTSNYYAFSGFINNVNASAAASIPVGCVFLFNTSYASGVGVLPGGLLYLVNYITGAHTQNASTIILGAESVMDPPANGAFILTATGGDAIKGPTGMQINTSDTEKFLRHDGTWAEPSGSDGPYYVAGSGSIAAKTSTPYYAARWRGSNPNVTSLYSGLCIYYKIDVAGNGSYGTVLAITTKTVNDEEVPDEHPVVVNVNSMVSTRYPVGCVIPLVYDADQTATAYINSGSASTITGCWKIAEYDTNTVTQIAHRDFAVNKDAGTLYRYQVCAVAEDGGLVPYNNVNNAYTNYVKAVNTAPFDPSRGIFFYATTTVVAPGSFFPASNTLYKVYQGDARYSFNVNATVNGATNGASVYATTVSYAVGSYVVYGAVGTDYKLYRCTTAANKEAWNAAHWAVVDFYSSTAEYAVNDECIHEGFVYKCTSAIAEGGEVWNSSHWTMSTLTGFIQMLPIYIKAKYNKTTHTATFTQNLDSPSYVARSGLVQALPESNPNIGLQTNEFYIYIYLGTPYTAYQFGLYANNQVYYWNARLGKVTEFDGIVETDLAQASHTHTTDEVTVGALGSMGSVANGDRLLIGAPGNTAVKAPLALAFDTTTANPTQFLRKDGTWADTPTPASITDYIHDGNYTTAQYRKGGLVIGAANSTEAGGVNVTNGRIYVTGVSNPLFGLKSSDSGATQFFLQVTKDHMFVGPTSTNALDFASTGKTTLPNDLTVKGKIIKNGGTSSQFLKADGSVDSNTYLTADSPGRVRVCCTSDSAYTPTLDQTAIMSSLISGEFPQGTYDNMLADWQNGITTIIVDDTQGFTLDDRSEKNQIFYMMWVDPDTDSLVFESRDRRLVVGTQDDWQLYDIPYANLNTTDTTNFLRHDGEWSAPPATTVDTALSNLSSNPVTNSAITTALSKRLSVIDLGIVTPSSPTTVQGGTSYSVSFSGPNPYLMTIVHPTSVAFTATLNTVPIKFVGVYSNEATVEATTYRDIAGLVVIDGSVHEFRLFIVTSGASGTLIIYDSVPTICDSIPTNTSDLTNDGSDGNSTYLEADETAYKTSSIPYGQVDSTSTSTAYTATVPGITELRDGVCMWLKNGVVDSASGFTINVNGLGAKPSYSNLKAATRDTTLFNEDYTFLFVYDSTRVSGGCWVCYRGYDANTNTIGYQLRGNSSTLVAQAKFYRYRLLFTSADGTKWVPANTSSSTNATSARTVNQTKINPFGEIVYYSSTTAIDANAAVTKDAIWQQYTLTLGYSFNRSGAALALTSNAPVYVKATPQSDGSAIMDADTPIVQSLPTTEDGKIYIFLGLAYSATAIELRMKHPVYQYKNGAIVPWVPTANISVSGTKLVIKT